MTYVFFTDRNLGKRFPAILREARIDVERHDDHFDERTTDEEWLREVASRGWVAISHDQRIRYKRNELEAVVRHEARLLIAVGRAPFPDLAANFVRTLPRITTFLDRFPAPLIAKLHRPTPAELRRRSDAPGRIER